MVIHAWCRKHHLTSYKSDQIYQVLTKSITVRKGKESLYYIEYKMMEQYGSFGGLDNCDHVEFDNFEKCSILIFDNEDKAIDNWYDVNKNLDVLCKKKVISSKTVNSMSNKAQKPKRENVVDKYSKGSTYIPFKYAIYF